MDGTTADVDDLALVEAFVNTREEPDDTSEFLTAPEQLGRWLSHHGLLERGERITGQAELERAVALREALRDLMVANHDEEAPPRAALDLLEREAARVPVTMAFGDAPDARLRPAGDGLDRAVAILLTIVFDAMRSGEWERMKVCRSATCIAAFHDDTRNRAGRFCSQGCRNVTKVRNYRERQRGG